MIAVRPGVRGLCQMLIVLGVFLSLAGCGDLKSDKELTGLCKDNPCGAGACTNVSETEYSCDCESGFEVTDDSAPTCAAISCNGRPDMTRCSRTPQHYCVLDACVDIHCGDTACNTAAPTFVIGDTGQTECRDATSLFISCCADDGDEVCGQDAESGWDRDNPGVTRWSRDNSSGIVTDSVTGLQWAGCLPGQIGTTCTGGASFVNYAAAVSECTTSVLGEFDDWRVPDWWEISSLYVLDDRSPLIDDVAFPNASPRTSPTTPPAPYWTRTASTKNVGAMRIMNFVNVFVGELLTEELATVRCVRGAIKTLPLATERYLDPSLEVLDAEDTVILDTATNLQWTRTCASGQTWAEAVTYCQDLSEAGGSDWRLANLREIETHWNPAAGVSTLPLENVEDIFYWSSTHLNDIASAYIHIRPDGAPSAEGKTARYAACCVRDP